MHCQAPDAGRHCLVHDCGTRPVRYATAWDLQKQLVAERQARPETPDVIVLLEHAPVYTMGTGADADYLLFDPQRGVPAGADFFRADRGGEVTYHGPGQLVCYPILNLKRMKRMDLHWHLRTLEEAVMRLLVEDVEIASRRVSRKEGMTGVWVDDSKVCAIGIRVSRGWITSHGLALNVTTDLQPFQSIVPCGISDFPVGRLCDLDVDQALLDQERLRAALLRHLGDLFGPWTLTYAAQLPSQLLE